MQYENDKNINEYLNKITLADCMDVMKKLPDKSIDLVLTDPPYLYKKMSGQGSLIRDVDKMADGLKDMQDGFNVDLVFNEYKRLLKKFNLFCFCSNNQISKIMAWGEKQNFITTLLTWHKTNVVPFANGVWKQDAEYCIHIRENGAYFVGDSNLKSKVYSHPTVKSEWDNPAQKPIKLIKKYLQIGSKEQDLVLDSFSGSGTTAVACNDMKRNFICVEINPKQYKLSVERLKIHKSQMKLF